MSKQWTVRVPDEVWAIIQSHAALHRISDAKAMAELVKAAANQPNATTVTGELQQLHAEIIQELTTVREQLQTMVTHVDALPTKAFIQNHSIFNAEITGTNSGRLSTSEITLKVSKKSPKAATTPDAPKG